MAVYLFANNKGGVGKTTLSTNFAAALAKYKDEADPNAKMCFNVGMLHVADRRYAEAIRSFTTVRAVRCVACGAVRCVRCSRVLTRRGDCVGITHEHTQACYCVMDEA